MQITEEGRDFFDYLARLEAASPPMLRVESLNGNTSTATFLTLAKRLSYRGGRKARRAERRMIEGVWGPTLVPARVELEAPASTNTE